MPGDECQPTWFAGLPQPPRQPRTDMVVLAHIKEQSRLSQGSYGRPRMTEELKEVAIDLGHRRVGRVRQENAPPGCFVNLLTAAKRDHR